MRADGFRERGAAVTRLEAFVDAAFAFAVTLLTDVAQRWGDVDPSTWGWASNPRPIAPGVEMALLVRSGGSRTFATATALPAHPMEVTTFKGERFNEKELEQQLKRFPPGPGA